MSGVFFLVDFLVYTLVGWGVLRLLSVIDSDARGAVLAAAALLSIASWFLAAGFFEYVWFPVGSATSFAASVVLTWACYVAGLLCARELFEEFELPSEARAIGGSLVVAFVGAGALRLVYAITLL